MARWNDDAHEAVPDDDVLRDEARTAKEIREGREPENHLTPANHFMSFFQKGR
jgi:hypothetical protein